MWFSMFLPFTCYDNGTYNKGCSFFILIAALKKVKLKDFSVLSRVYVKFKTSGLRFWNEKDMTELYKEVLPQLVY